MRKPPTMRIAVGTLICIALAGEIAPIAAQPLIGPSLSPAPPTSAGIEGTPPSTPWQLPPNANVAGETTPPLQEGPLPPPGADAVAAEAAGLTIEEPASEDLTWYQPSYWFGPAPWDSGIELGLNGSSGTSDSMSIRTGGYIKRESRFSKLDLNSYYNRTTNGGVATQNNANLDVRNDWLLSDSSPWTLYGTGNVFYDEFQAFDLQTNANSGIGYRFVHDPDLLLMTRFGMGASREIGGPDDRWVPESLLGFEYNQQVNATQKFYGKLDYFPEWDQVGEFRLVADVGWEIELVQPTNLSLKIAATDRYDSTPNGSDPHLVNYSVLLLRKL